MTANEISDRLRVGAKKIMDLWEIRAKKEISAALNQSSLALRNTLPEYLTQVMDALSGTIDRTPSRIESDKSESIRVGRKHGRDRGNFSTYSIAQLIFEYQILRQTIFQVLEEREELPKIARDIIIDSIEQAVNDASTQFSETIKDFQEQVAATITHDLRTPITSAKLSAQLIMRAPEKAESSLKFADRIVKNMDRVDSMIQNLLDSSRIRAGQKLELTFQYISLKDLVLEVCQDLNLIYDDRIKLNSVPLIDGYWSKQALWRTLENLVNNAIKYGSAESPIIVKFESDIGKIKLSIHNEGNPIPPDEMGLLFDRFHRNRGTGGKEGWGIGLSLVKGVVEAHKGKVWVESSKAEGTTFFVELPIDFRNQE